MDVNTKKKFIKSYFKSSSRRLDYCRQALEKQDYSYIIRECQAIVKLCSKALILRWGFVVPQKHDLREELVENKDLYSSKFQENIGFIKKLSKNLRTNRELSLYGDIDEGLPPNEL